jgi:polyhydroxybutyrate depolymerase
MKKEAALLFAGTLVAAIFAIQDDSEKTIRVGDVERTYRVHVPGTYKKGTPVPLVFDLHGGGSNGKQQHRFSGMVKIADREGFIVVHPDGIDRRWNDGRIAKEADDVGFLKALLDALSKEFSIDPRRIYATGISNGGFMSQRLAIELSDRFAAIAPVTAGIGDQVEFKPEHPVSVLLMNGTEDPLVPYNGGFVARSGTKTLSTDDAVKKWVAHNGCSERPTTEELPDKDPNDGTRVTRSVWSGGKNNTEVVLYRIDGGGHTWPGGNQYLPERIIGKVCRDMEGSEIIWEFFKNHPKPIHAGFRTIEFGSRSARLWYPTMAAAKEIAYAGKQPGLAAENAPMAPGKHPLILFSHGLWSHPEFSAFLLEELARAGFIVAGVLHKDSTTEDKGGWEKLELPKFGKPADWNDTSYVERKDDLAALLDHLIATEGDRIDKDAIGAMGHSMGGYTVMGMAGGWPSWTDKRVKAALLLSPYILPYREVDKVAVPIMMQGATLDLGITPFLPELYKKLSAPKYLLVLKDETHFAWINFICKKKSTADAVKDGNAKWIAQYSAAFFEQHLRNRPQALLGKPNPDLASFEFPK